MEPISSPDSPDLLIFACAPDFRASLEKDSFLWWRVSKVLFSFLFAKIRWGLQSPAFG